MGKRAAMMMVLAAPAAAVEGDARALFEAWVAEHGKEYEEGEYEEPINGSEARSPGASGGLTRS